MVPQNMWFQNLRQILTKKQWDEVRKDAFKKQDNKCFICGKTPKRLEGHELWIYDFHNKTQKLDKVIGLCPLCHMTIHIGHSQLIGKESVCVAHYCKINNCSIDECEEDYIAAWDLWHKKNEVDWTLDLSWLEENYSIKVNYESLDRNHK